MGAFLRTSFQHLPFMWAHWSVSLSLYHNSLLLGQWHLYWKKCCFFVVVVLFILLFLVFWPPFSSLLASPSTYSPVLCGKDGPVVRTGANWWQKSVLKLSDLESENDSPRIVFCARPLLAKECRIKNMFSKKTYSWNMGFYTRSLMLPILKVHGF